MNKLEAKMNQLKLTQENLLVFKEAVKAMVEFRKAFNRDLEPSFIAELYAAEKLELEIFPSKTMPGYDALDKAGKRYQIKYRSPMTQNVDINNYDFDLLILINLDENYRLCGIWRISVDQAKKIFTWREKYRKYQATQNKIINIAERIS